MRKLFVATFVSLALAPLALAGAGKK